VHQQQMHSRVDDSAAAHPHTTNGAAGTPHTCNIFSWCIRRSISNCLSRQHDHDGMLAADAQRLIPTIVTVTMLGLVLPLAVAAITPHTPPPVSICPFACCPWLIPSLFAVYDLLNPFPLRGDKQHLLPQSMTNMCRHLDFCCPLLRSMCACSV
jgi:hypothetical protein